MFYSLVQFPVQCYCSFVLVIHTLLSLVLLILLSTAKNTIMIKWKGNSPPQREKNIVKSTKRIFFPVKVCLFIKHHGGGKWIIPTWLKLLPLSVLCGLWLSFSNQIWDVLFSQFKWLYSFFFCGSSVFQKGYSKTSILDTLFFLNIYCISLFF